MQTTTKSPTLDTPTNRRRFLAAPVIARGDAIAGDPILFAFVVACEDDDARAARILRERDVSIRRDGDMAWVDVSRRGWIDNDPLPARYVIAVCRGQIEEVATPCSECDETGIVRWTVRDQERTARCTCEVGEVEHG